MDKARTISVELQFKGKAIFEDGSIGFGFGLFVRDLAGARCSATSG